MNLENPVITQVEIIGLHKDRDIRSNFQNPVKILVDENGTGKTTFLNILVGLLQGKWRIVNRYNSKKLESNFIMAKPLSSQKRKLKEDT